MVRPSSPAPLRCGSPLTPDLQETQGCRRARAARRELSDHEVRPTSAPRLTERASSLLDALEERQNPLPEQRRGRLVVIRKAAVCEQVPVARIEEELGAIDRRDQLACRRQVFG